MTTVTVGTVLAMANGSVLFTGMAALGTEQIVPEPPQPVSTIQRGGYVPTDWPSAGKPFKYS